MSAILVVSVLLRLLAAIWSVYIARNLRDSRILLFTLMLVLMSTRQVWTLWAGLSAGEPVNLDITAHFDELPGLLVSILSFIILLNIETIIPRKLPGDSLRKTIPIRGMPLLPILIIGLFSIVGILVVGRYAYLASRTAIRQTVAEQNLALGRSITRLSLEKFDSVEGINRQSALARLADTWLSTDIALSSSYLCVIDSSGKLDLHTLNPEMKGTNVQAVELATGSGRTVRQLLDSKSDWCGQNTNFRGVTQLVGYYYEPSIDSLIAVHTPTKLVDDMLRSLVAPWIGAIVLIGGLMLPFALGFLFYRSRMATSLAETSLLAVGESESRHRRLVENAPFCIHEFALDGTFTSINRAGVQMLGLPDDSRILGQPYTTAVSDRDLPRIKQLFEQALAGHQSQFEFETSTGRSFDSSFVPLLSNDGSVQRIMGISRDITERKTAERELKRREQILSAVSTTAGLFLQGASWDSAIQKVLEELGKSTNSSRAYLFQTSPGPNDSVLCSQRAEWVDEGIEPQLANPDMQNMDFVEAGMGRWLEGFLAGEPMHGNVADFPNCEQEFLQAQSIQSLCVLPILVEGQLWGFVGFDQCETQRIWTEIEINALSVATSTLASAIVRNRTLADLRDSELRFRTIFEQAALGVDHVDSKTGKFLEVNQKYCEIVGYSHDEMIGRRYREITHPEDWEKDAENIADLLAGKTREVIVEKRLIRKDGAIVWIRLVVSPMWLPGETPTTLIGIIEDIAELKQMQQELWKEQARFRAVVENAWDAVSLVNAEGRSLYASPATERMLGYPVSELIGKTGFEFVHPEDLPKTMSMFQEALGQPGRNPVYELRMQRKDGQWRWIEASTTNLLHDPAVGAIAVNLRDVTERVLASEKEKRLLAILDATPDFVGIADINGYTVFVNRAGRQMMGFGEDEDLSAVHIRDYLSKASSDLVENVGVPEACRNKYWFGETVFRTRTGREIPSSQVVVSHSTEQGTIEFISTIARDISEQKAAEKRREELLRRNTAIVSAFGEIVYEAWPKTRRFVWEGDCEAVLGNTIDEMGTKIEDWTNRVHPDDLGPIMKEYDLALVQNRLFDIEYRFLDADRKYRWINDRGKTFVDENGEPDRVIGVMRDVTLRHEQEEALRSFAGTLEKRVLERTNELAEVNAELDSFAHTVSHDLRAPLRGMEAFALALTEDNIDQLDENGREYVGHILTSARQMDVLVNDLLTYSRLARTKFRPTDVSLESVVEEARNHLAKDIADSNAQIEVAGQLPTIVGHHGTLLQVVTNLISNAIKFVPVGVQPIVKISAEPKLDGWVRLWVGDNGIGIPPQHQERIFDAFERLHGVETFPGTGIGLAIVARACERMDGSCGVVSMPGEGSRFWVEFPGKA